MRADGALVSVLHRSSQEKVLNALGPAVEIYDPAEKNTMATLYAEDKDQRAGFDSRRSAFSPDGKWLGIAHVDSFDIWDVGTGKRAAQSPLEAFDIHGGVRFSPDGRSVLLGQRHSPEKIQFGSRLYETASGKLLHSSPLSRASNAVFSPDARLLVVNHGEAIKVHDARTGAERFTFAEQGQALPLAISPTVAGWRP